MRHRILVAVLALGAIGGYAAGFASLHAHHHACWAAHHEWRGPNGGEGAQGARDMDAPVPPNR